MRRLLSDPRKRKFVGILALVILFGMFAAYTYADIQKPTDQPGDTWTISVEGNPPVQVTAVERAILMAPSDLTITLPKGSTDILIQRESGDQGLMPNGFALTYSLNGTTYNHVWRSSKSSLNKIWDSPIRKVVIEIRNINVNLR